MSDNIIYSNCNDRTENVLSNKNNSFNKLQATSKSNSAASLANSILNGQMFNSNGFNSKTVTPK